MSDESDALEELAKAIADGNSINWDEIQQRLPANDALARRLRHLRLVADLAGIHGSHIEDSPASQDDVETLAGPADTAVLPLADVPAGSSEADGAIDPPADGTLRRWGHLLLLKKIGTGAFGEVYHAHDTWLDHPVALKLLRPELASRRLSSRVLHEARKLARVRHPNVVSVHGADSHDGQIGFWMDLVQGDTLADLVAGGRLSGGEATTIGMEVCRALTAVHQAKLLHRDVKAQNVMRASDGGRIILMDFGAGEFMDDVSVSMRGQGTPLYLAPEILNGGAASVGSDIYAVGVLLYHLVTGDFPVRGSSLADLVTAHQRGQRQRLHDARSDLPDSFVAIVERALAPDVAHRYASAGDMHAALAGEAAMLADAAVGPQPVDSIWLRRIGVVAGIAAAILLGTAGIGFIASRVFEVAMHIDDAFAAGPLKYLEVGAEALVGFVVHWLIIATVLSVLVGVRLLLRPRLEKLGERWARRLRFVDPAGLAILFFLAGAAAWVGLTWTFLDVFGALETLRTAVSPADIDISILTPAAREIHKAHGQYAAYLSFALGLVALRWFPPLERRATSAYFVRLLKWATILVAYATIVSATVPRRIVWEAFNEAVFENQRGLVIGENRAELLLYVPDAVGQTHVRVPLDDAALIRTGVARQLFAPWPAPR